MQNSVAPDLAVCLARARPELGMSSQALRTGEAVAPITRANGNLWAATGFRADDTFDLDLGPHQPHPHLVGQKRQQLLEPVIRVAAAPPAPGVLVQALTRCSTC